MVCLNTKCSKRLKGPEGLLKHINECFMPEYFRYLVFLKFFAKNFKEMIFSITFSRSDVVNHHFSICTLYSF